MNPHRLATVFLAALLGLAGVGCDGLVPVADETVVTIGEEEFSEETLDRFFERRTSLGGSPDAALLSALLDEFIRERLLVIAADEAGVEVSRLRLQAEIASLRQQPTDPDDTAAGEDDPEPAAEDPEEQARFRREVEERLRVSRFIETVVLAEVAVSDEAAQLEFEGSRPFYTRPETVTLSEWRFADRETADAAAARLREGNQEGADGRFTGIGIFRREELPESMDRAVFALEPGETTGVVETAAGFRIFRVEDRTEATPLEFADVQEVARLAVLEREADARVQAFLGELELRYPVRIHTSRLRFPYLGRMDPGP